MPTPTYQALSPRQKSEVSRYGVTVDGMREAFASSFTFRLSGPYMVVTSLMSDAQELIAHDCQEDARQTLNRAKWLLNNYQSIQVADQGVPGAKG